MISIYLYKKQNTETPSYDIDSLNNRKKKKNKIQINQNKYLQAKKKN